MKSKMIRESSFFLNPLPLEFFPPKYSLATTTHNPKRIWKSPCVSIVLYLSHHNRIHKVRYFGKFKHITYHQERKKQKKEKKMEVDLNQREADELIGNKWCRFPRLLSSEPPLIIPRRKRSIRRTEVVNNRVFFVDATSDVEQVLTEMPFLDYLRYLDCRRMQEELNKGKNVEEQIPIRTVILDNSSELEVAATCLFNLSRQMVVRPKRPHSAAWDEEIGGREKIKKMRTKKETTSVLHIPDPPPELPANFRERIEAKGGSGVVLVIQKKIFPSDVKDDLNRLSIPEKEVKNKFLSAEEEALLLSRDEKGKKKHIGAVMIGPSSPQDEYRVNLVKWEMKKGGGKKSSWTYNLVTTWKTVVKENNLQPEMIVQLWSYRVDSKLNFALVIC